MLFYRIPDDTGYRFAPDTGYPFVPDTQILVGYSVQLDIRYIPNHYSLRPHFAAALCRTRSLGSTGTRIRLLFGTTSASSSFESSGIRFGRRILLSLPTII